MNTYTTHEHKEVTPWQAMEQDSIDTYRNIQPSNHSYNSHNNPTIHGSLSKHNSRTAPNNKIKNARALRYQTEENFTNLKRYYYVVCSHNKSDLVNHPKLF